MAKVPSKFSVKATMADAELVAKHSGAARKLHSGFDKLTKKQQKTIANRLSLQKYFPDDPDYSNKNIRNKILSYLGVASGEFDDLKAIGKDSYGEDKLLLEQKHKNPAGFAGGGMVHRGRKAMRGAD